MLPLAGIRVIDLGSVAMAPYAGQWLGDLGADVIKIEPPAGDSTRRTGPTPEANMGPQFLSLNRNKRSVVLDLKQPEAVEALLTLIDGADVFLHNIRPQKIARLGLDGETLRRRNPRLVYASFHGFGDAGPYSGRAAYDDIIQGLTGCADILGRQAGAPRYFPAIVADKTCGLVGAIAILSAIVKRERTGVGGCVEIPMFESMAAFNLVEHFYGAHYSPPSAPMGYPRVLAASRRPFATTDGYICMLPYSDAQWRSFFTEAGRPELADDPRFVGIGARTDNSDLLYRTAGELIAQRDTRSWLDACEALSIPAAPMLTLEMIPDDPHLKAVDFFATLTDDALGEVKFPGVPVIFDGKRPPIAFPPRLGEHNAEILGERDLPADAAP